MIMINLITFKNAEVQEQDYNAFEKSKGYVVDCRSLNELTTYHNLIQNNYLITDYTKPHCNIIQLILQFMFVIIMSYSTLILIRSSSSNLY